jgi:hypothetical protein
MMEPEADEVVVEEDAVVVETTVNEMGYPVKGVVTENATTIRDADGFVGARNLFVEKPFHLENGGGRSYEGGRGGSRARVRGGRGFGEGEERSRRREFDRHSGNARG